MARPNTAWANTAAYQTTWTWYEAEIGPGTSRLHFTGSSKFARTRLHAWAWTEWDLSGTAVTIDIPCAEPAMPQHRYNVERLGAELRQLLSLWI